MKFQILIFFILFNFAAEYTSANSFIQGDQFHLIVLNSNQKSGNALVMVEFSGECKKYPIEIGVRKDARSPVLILKKETVEIPAGENKTFFSLSLDLLRGKYLISAEIEDIEKQIYYFKDIIFQCNPPGNQPWLSDIRFFTCPDEKPLFSENLVGKSGMLHFAADLSSQKDELLAARAVLFRKNSNGSGLPKYVSVEQISSVLDPVRSSVFENDFSIQGLEPGEYLVELYLYRREKLFLAMNRTFRIRWPGLDSLLQNPDSALRLMIPVCSINFIRSFQNLTRLEEKQSAIIGYWTQFNPVGSNFSTNAMEGYFARLSEALNLFPQPSSPGENDRLKVWLWYGQPDRKKNVTIQNSETEIWYYNAWGLKISYNKKNGLWKAIELPGPKV